MYKGVVEDKRPKEEKILDFQHREIATAASPVVFTEKRIEEINYFETRDQDGSSTCMGQAYAKMRGILLKQKTGQYVSLSGGYLYRRKRTLGFGMGLWDIMDLGKKLGLPFDAIDKSQDMNETDILNAVEAPYIDEVASLFTDPNEAYIYIKSYSFDELAQVIAQGNPVHITLFGEYSEYDIIPTVDKKNLTPSIATIRHGVCAHDLVRYQGEDYIVMDDSWGVLNSKVYDNFELALKKRGQRLLSREWVNARVYGAAYIKDLSFSFGDDDNKPSHVFSRTLEYSPTFTTDGEVVALQDILKYEGLFSTDVSSSGYYGAITARAVLAFQRKHNVASNEELDELQGRVVGPKTIEKLNSLYGK